MEKLILAGIILLYVGNAESSGAWSYEGETGPEHWPHISETCGGKKQSPIDIKNPEYKDLGQFTFNPEYGKTPPANQLDLVNNGHAIQVNVPESLDITVSGGGLDGTYQLAQFHMHWGSTDCRGSEHTVDGKQYPLEIHYVHFNTAYGNLGTALGHDDGVAVLGVFVDVHDRSNPTFEKITNQLAQVKYSGSTAKLASPFAMNSLLPTNTKDFIRYSGSLTTPNCNEVVTWTLFNTPIYISHTQMNAMRAVSFDTSNDGKDIPMVNNYRPVQKLYDRDVYKTFNFKPQLPSPQGTCGATGILVDQNKSILMAITVIAGILLSRW